MHQLKPFILEFLKAFFRMILLFLFALWVSKNNIAQGFLDYSWIFLIAALITAAVKCYLKPKWFKR